MEPNPPPPLFGPKLSPNQEHLPLFITMSTTYLQKISEAAWSPLQECDFRSPKQKLARKVCYAT